MQSSFSTKLRTMLSDFDAMQPQQSITLSDPSVELEGYIVVWNTKPSATGPLPQCAKGGTRLRKGLSLAEVTMLARTMALKNASAGLPLGGAKSGINADPRAKGFKQRYTRFVELSKPYLYENGGVFGGFGFDIGAAPEHALWACETLGSTRSFTGKPLAMGGTDYDKQGIAGLGVATAAKTLIEQKGQRCADMTFAVHGVGAMGAAVCRSFSADGAQLCAIGDPRFGGSWRFKNNISETLLNAIAAQHDRLVRKLLPQEASLIDSDANAVLFEDCDALFPCALQHAIELSNVEQLKTRYIIEGANSPIHHQAYDAIARQQIMVVPDFVANAGGVIAAFVELSSSDTIDKANAAKIQTVQRISNNVKKLCLLADAEPCTLREAGLYQALDVIL